MNASAFRHGLLGQMMLFAGLPLLLASNASAAPTAKDAKVAVYIEMINAESNHIFDGEATYAKWVADPRVGPMCNESGIRFSGGPTSTENYAHYRKELAKGPKLDADAAALQMVDALEQLHAPLEEASAYYYTNKYLHDGCKRAKELHPLLMTGWSKYDQADAQLRAFVEKLDQEREAGDLAEALKKYGKGFHYYHRKLLVDSKGLVHSIETQARAEKPDLSIPRGQLATLDQTLAETKALVTKGKAGKDSKALYEGGYEDLVTKADWYRDAADHLLKKLDPSTDARTFGPDDRERVTKNVVNAYNDLVDESNKVLYSASMK